MKRRSARSSHVAGSGNVFRDLRLPKSEEELTKSALLFEIAQAIERRGLNQTEAARLLGIPQPQVSNLLRGRTAGVSVQRLTTLLTRLGKGVTIVISDIPHQAGLPRLPVVRDSKGIVSRMASEGFAIDGSQATRYGATARGVVRGARRPPRPRTTKTSKSPYLPSQTSERTRSVAPRRARSQ